MARLFDDALDEYLSLAGSAPATAYPLTMAAWVKPDASQAIATILSLGDDGSSKNLFELRLASLKPALLVVNNAGGLQVTTSGDAGALNTWFHACGVFASSTARHVYYNGGSKATGATDLTPTAGNIDQTSIGRMRYNGAWYYAFSGSIAEVAIYSAALTDDEVLALAMGYSPQLVRPGDIAAYWPLGGLKSSDNAANDASGDRDIVGGYHVSPLNTPGVADHPPIIYPSGVQVFPAAAAGGVTIMNQIQKANLGADLYDGALIA